MKAKNSTPAEKIKATKPKKPYEGFPLTAHPRGAWCKKVKGKIWYFGPWADPDAALKAWLRDRDDIMAGRKPRARVVGTTDDGGGYTIRDLANEFLIAKQRRVDSGELAKVTFNDYYDTVTRIVNHFGKPRVVADIQPSDFAELRVSLSKTRGPRSLGNEINRVRIVFRFAYTNGRIAKPMQFGSEFTRPNRKHVRKVRQSKGKRMFEAADLRTIINSTTDQLKAMVLLGANCGFGNSDVANLPITALDLDQGWVEFPRTKTAIERRCPFWQETIAAIKDVLAKRGKPKTKDDSDILFLTRCGERWVRCVDTPKEEAVEDGKKKKTGMGLWRDAIRWEFKKLLVSLELHRAGLGFYSLRHGFQTVGGGTRDRDAVKSIMGHTEGSMSEEYNEGIDDDRLKAVTDHIHKWLFTENEPPATIPIRSA